MRILASSLGIYSNTHSRMYKRSPLTHTHTHTHTYTLVNNPLHRYTGILIHTNTGKLKFTRIHLKSFSCLLVVEVQITFFPGHKRSFHFLKLFIVVIYQMLAF
jgi:hypothetical protein